MVQIFILKYFKKLAVDLNEFKVIKQIFFYEFLSPKSWKLLVVIVLIGSNFPNEWKKQVK